VQHVRVLQDLSLLLNHEQLQACLADWRLLLMDPAAGMDVSVGPNPCTQLICVGCTPSDN
jgi:hypothetical protein